MANQPKPEFSYLGWFAENLHIAARAASQLHLVFQLRFFHFPGVWVAGLAYDEPYDGAFFLESLKGEGGTVKEALRQAVEKSRPIVEMFSELFEKFEVSTTFKQGCDYYLVELDRDGFLTWCEMTKSPQHERDPRPSFKHQSGRGLVFPLENSLLIYAATPELKSWLEEHDQSF